MRYPRKNPHASNIRDVDKHVDNVDNFISGEDFRRFYTRLRPP